VNEIKFFYRRQHSKTMASDGVRRSYGFRGWV